MAQSPNPASAGGERLVSRWVVFGEWLLVFPATAFLAAAALRNIQPRLYQPGRAGWFLFEWTMTHVSRAGAAALFIGMPSVVLLVGCAALLRAGCGNQALRQDADTALAILRRQLAPCLLATATLLAGAILTAVFAHVITD